MSSEGSNHIPDLRQRDLIRLTPAEWLKALADAQNRRDAAQSEVWVFEDLLAERRKILRLAQRAVEELLEPAVMPAIADLKPAGKVKKAK